MGLGLEFGFGLGLGSRHRFLGRQAPPRPLLRGDGARGAIVCGSVADRAHVEVAAERAPVRCAAPG